MAKDKNNDEREEKARLAGRRWLIILFFLLLGGWFYWFQWRPARIRAKCDKEVLMNRYYATSEAEKETLNWDMVKINAIEREKSEHFYKFCLHEHGLEK